MLDVLIFIYQNHWDTHGTETDHPKTNEADEAVLAHTLAQAGFKHQDILQAFDWVQQLRLSTGHTNYLVDTQAMRLYCELERETLGEQGLQFLQQLQATGILTAQERDLIIDRALALPQSNVSIEDVRWITMMALGDSPRKEDYLFVEDALLASTACFKH